MFLLYIQFFQVTIVLLVSEMYDCMVHFPTSNRSESLPGYTKKSFLNTTVPCHSYCSLCSRTVLMMGTSPTKYRPGKFSRMFTKVGIIFYAIVPSYKYRSFDSRHLQYGYYCTKNNNNKSENLPGYLPNLEFKYF